MTEQLDCTGLMCPMPIVKISKAVKALRPGDTLEVRADDAAFEPDVRAWCDKMKQNLVDLTKDGRAFVAVIEKR